MIDLFPTKTAFHFIKFVDYLWIIVMFYQLFELSFWRHPFTAEDLLVSKWYKCPEVEYIFS